MAQRPKIDIKTTTVLPHPSPPASNSPRACGDGRVSPLPSTVLLALVFALTGPCCQLAYAQETQAPPARSPSGDGRFEAESQDRLVQQKLRLLQSYLGTVSGGRLAESEKPEIGTHIAEARAHYDAALHAYGTGDLAQAAALTDLGLRSIARASAAAGRPKTQQDAAPSRERLAVLRRQIQGYLATLQALLQDPDLQAAHGSALQQVEELLARSAELERTAAYAEAGALLSEAYPITLRVVAALHQGRTLVSRLEFASPEEEFSYEKKRYESYELLVSLARQQEVSTAGITDDALTGRHLAAARELRDQAEAEARERNFEQSIRTMERANRQLVYALQSAGLEFFY